MKEQLKSRPARTRPHRRGLISYSIRSIWTTYQTIAVVLGGCADRGFPGREVGEIRAGSWPPIDAIRNQFRNLRLVLHRNSGVRQLPRRATREARGYDDGEDLQPVRSVRECRAAGQAGSQIKAFYPGGEYAPAKDLLELFKAKNNKISYEFIDPDKQPQIAQQYQVTQYGDFQNPMTGESFRYGTLILEMGGKTERIEKQSEPLREEDVTNALMKIVKGEKKTIYFVQGHGEKNIDDTEKQRLQQAPKRVSKKKTTSSRQSISFRKARFRTTLRSWSWWDRRPNRFPMNWTRIDGFLE